MEITRLAEVIEALTGVPTRYLGAIDHVRSECGMLYVYSASGSADLAVLARAPHYITTDLDLWCWRGPFPDWELCDRDAYDPFHSVYRTVKPPFELEDFVEREPAPDLERHGLRVFERFHKLAEILFNPAFEHAAKNRRALEQLPELSLDEWNAFVTGALAEVA